VHLEQDVLVDLVLIVVGDQDGDGFTSSPGAKTSVPVSGLPPQDTTSDSSNAVPPSVRKLTVTASTAGSDRRTVKTM
jgi:hypothetical protein